MIACDLPERVRGDPVRLRQILVNLPSNAIQLTPEGKVAQLVSVARRDAERVWLEAQVEYAPQPSLAGSLPL